MESSAVSFDVPVYEGYDAKTGDLRAISEAAQDMVGVYEAMHGYAMAELGVEQGTVTMEAAGEKGRNIFQRILDALKKLWGKIRNFFDNIIVNINAKVKNGKEFAKKYKSRFKAIGFKPDVYPYTGLKQNPVKTIFTDCSEFIAKQRDRATDPADFTSHKTTIIEELRGSLVGDSRLDSDEFKKKSVEYFRGAKDTKEMTLSADGIISVLENETALKEAKEAKTNMDKSFTETIKGISDMQKEYETQLKKLEDSISSGDYGTVATAHHAMNGAAVRDRQWDHSRISTGFSNDKVREKKKVNDAINWAKHRQTLFTEAQSICTAFFNTWKEVYNEREKVYKGIIVKALKNGSGADV
jgi:hypothetical protein